MLCVSARVSVCARRTCCRARSTFRSIVCAVGVHVQVWLDKKLLHDRTVFPDRSFEYAFEVDGKPARLEVLNKIISLQVRPT